MGPLGKLEGDLSEVNGVSGGFPVTLPLLPTGDFT